MNVSTAGLPLRAARAVLDAPQRAAAWFRRSGIRRATGVAPVLGFGGVLDGERLIHGGAVKLLSLRDNFASCEDAFNLLYLVSSSQPEFAEDMASICRRRGIPLVWNQNGVGYPGWAGNDAERHNAPMRRLRAQASFVVYQSEFCRSCADQFLGPCDVPFEVLLNPVDLDKFRPSDAAASFEPVRLLAMGTQNYRERAMVALACVQALRAGGIKATLTMAGPVEWKRGGEELAAAARKMAIEDFVELRPPFRQEEAPDIYRAHHILLHPKYLDPCPTVVAEALACGLPVVASRSGGLPEMVGDDCGELIEVPLVWDRMVTPSGDELAQAVVRLLPRLEAARSAARARAEQAFDARRWVERHREIFTSLPE
ncbi:MAG: glycosyltransferase family 4 protein [Chthoniobacterales bacterium]|nr:glycosyltransferase family 4 protein [Chthoniobacterales bacterium]